jgi:predicted small metal-binding protein
MERKMIDCRKVPNEIGCTLTIAGSEEEVLDAAAAHAVAKHGHADTPELREMLRSGLEPAEPAIA